jgi:gluconate 2-dehydrogenase gamma chain
MLGNPRDEAPPRFLNESERRFLLAAVDCLIPPDEHWPGAAEADVVNYIDLQMGGQWGQGELLYRHGPFRKGTPSQGYQLEYTPAELFRRSIAAINLHFSTQGKPFDQLSPAEKDAYLTSLEKGAIDLRRNNTRELSFAKRQTAIPNVESASPRIARHVTAKKV